MRLIGLDSAQRTEKFKRNEYIDFLRGIGIILVVLGHCWMIPKDIYIYIYSFHMPLFL